MLSEEQVAAAAAKKAADELLRKHRKLADADARRLNNSCGRLQRAAARLRTAPGSRLTEAMVEDLESELTKARAAEAACLDCAGRGMEPPDMSELKRSCETAAKVAENRCKELGLP